MKNFTDIKEIAAFRWNDILPALGISSEKLNGKHQACQGCGGKDRFRYVGGADGKWFCSQGGATTGGDGFELLCHVFGWSKSESLNAVAEYLGVKNKPVNHEQLKEKYSTNIIHLNTEMAINQKNAKEKAQYLWSIGCAAIGHPYLEKKQIKPVQIRRLKDILLVPMYLDGELVNIHRIFADGKKRFLKGGRVTGCWMMLGDESDHYYIVEGYATGCTIHENMGVSVIVAFNAGNLDPVAKAIREKYPDAEITIAADNDIHTVGNAGLTKARKAALAVDGDIIYPDFSDLGGDGTDFNDYVIAGGAL